MHQHRPSKIEGAGNAGCSPHPRPRTQSKKAYEQFTTGTPKHSGIPRAMVLTASFVLSLVIGLSCHHRRPRCASITAHLTSASRRQDHTTSPSAAMSFVFSTPRRPSPPAPNVRDDRETPLDRGRDDTRSIAVSTNSLSEIFLTGGWTEN
jgi:hypothetical protein